MNRCPGYTDLIDDKSRSAVLNICFQTLNCTVAMVPKTPSTLQLMIGGELQNEPVTQLPI